MLNKKIIQLYEDPNIYHELLCQDIESLLISLNHLI